MLSYHSPAQLGCNSVLEGHRGQEPTQDGWFIPKQAQHSAERTDASPAGGDMYRQGKGASEGAEATKIQLKP